MRREQARGDPDAYSYDGAQHDLPTADLVTAFL